MTITLSDIDFLTSDRGERAIQSLHGADLSDANVLSLITSLRKTYTREEASAALTMAQLREKAEGKFGDDAGQMFFTDAGLQQASDPLIRAYRAREVAGLRVLDVGCGIGSDSMAFARAGASVTGIDIDSIRVAIAKHNARRLGIDHVTYAVADARDVDTRDYDLIFYDPARRDSAGNRIYDVEHYQPPLSLLRQWQAPRIMAKISPGVNTLQLEPYTALVEFISVAGDLKEAVLHTGNQETGLKATLLTDDDIHHWRQNKTAAIPPITEPQAWLVEPDASLLRASLVQDVTTHFEGAMLDETIAYFTTEQAIQSPWVRAWRIREWLPFHLKNLRARLRSHDVGTLTVKKRGSPIMPGDLIRKLKLDGTQSATVVLTRCKNDPIAIICDDIATS